MPAFKSHTVPPVTPWYCFLAVPLLGTHLNSSTSTWHRDTSTSVLATAQFTIAKLGYKEKMVGIHTSVIQLQERDGHLPENGGNWR